MTEAAGSRLRIAAFGFRSIPPRAGAAGADKFALELLPRLAARGHEVTCYNRVYPTDPAEAPHDFRGVRVIPLRTVARSGFDTLLHSSKATWDIIAHNRAKIVHMQNGGNSLFALFLRLAGKKTFMSQDGLDWDRPKWPWYAKLYLKAMRYLTATVHSEVIFDNPFAKDYFEKRFKRTYAFVPFGADVATDSLDDTILAELGVERGEYFLFVGRFIPDKGVHLLVEAFERLSTTKKLVLVGGSPNPSDYEAKIRATKDPRIILPGFVYGSRVHALMQNCYAYVQPSEIEGLSPVVLESAFLGAPIICAGIEQNRYSMADDAIYFTSGDAAELEQRLAWAIANPDALRDYARRGQARVRERFSWNAVVAQHLELFASR